MGYATTLGGDTVIVLQLPRDEFNYFLHVIRDVPNQNHLLFIRLDQNNRVTSWWLTADGGYEGNTEKDRRDRLEAMLRSI